jgi:hypothetical protein
LENKINVSVSASCPHNKLMNQLPNFISDDF